MIFYMVLLIVLMQLLLLHLIAFIDERTKDIEGILRDISGVLLSFIQTNPEAWAPILSSVRNLNYNDIYYIYYLYVTYSQK